MDSEDPPRTPVMTKELLNNSLHLQRRAHYAESMLPLDSEMVIHERAKQANKRLQAQLDIFMASDLQARRQIQNLVNNNIGLSNDDL
jgi:hypothetical protein